MAVPSRLRLAATLTALLALPATGYATPVGSYSFSNFDDPNAMTYTFANGVNNVGQVVGSYDATGFLLNTNGSFTDIVAPQAAYLTSAIGINNAGQIVGTFVDASFNNGTFLRGGDGSYSTVPTPGPNFAATGVNDSGQIVGAGAHKSAVIGASGTATALPAPDGATKVAANGINNAGTVVGAITDAAGLHGFQFDTAGYTLFDDPSGIGATVATALNNVGQIVGYYTGTDSVSHAFLDIEGAFLTLDDPAATDGTVALGINDLGTIVGYYMDDAGEHAFIATPSTDGMTSAAPVPEPASLALLCSTAALAGALRRRRA